MHRASNPIHLWMESQTRATPAFIPRSQVAQLWQRDREKFDTFSIKVQRYSQNHTQKCIYGPPYVCIGRNVSGLFESFNAKEHCSRVSSKERQIYS